MNMKERREKGEEFIKAVKKATNEYEELNNENSGMYTLSYEELHKPFTI